MIGGAIYAIVFKIKILCILAVSENSMAESVSTGRKSCRCRVALLSYGSRTRGRQTCQKFIWHICRCDNICKSTIGYSIYVRKNKERDRKAYIGYLWAAFSSMKGIIAVDILKKTDDGWEIY